MFVEHLMIDHDELDCGALKNMMKLYDEKLKARGFVPVKLDKDRLDEVLKRMQE